MVLVHIVETEYGAVHKRRRQFFWIFNTPFPHVGSFLVLSVSNLDQFLTPSPLQIADVVYGRPHTGLNGKEGAVATGVGGGAHVTALLPLLHSYMTIRTIYSINFSSPVLLII